MSIVDNAGISRRSSIETTTEAEMDARCRVNVKEAFFLMQKLLPADQGRRRIGNLSNGLSRIVVPGRARHGWLKAAFDVLTLYQAKESGRAA